jgi:hypothetical protein
MIVTGGHYQTVAGALLSIQTDAPTAERIAITNAPTVMTKILVKKK